MLELDDDFFALDFDLDAPDFLLDFGPNERPVAVELDVPALPDRLSAADGDVDRPPTDVRIELRRPCSPSGPADRADDVALAPAAFWPPFCVAMMEPP